MGIKDDLKRAIDARNIISFNYKGHTRVVEPYHYGLLYMTPQYKLIKKPQEDSLLCYQIEGTSSSNLKKGKPIEFKTMVLNGIENLKINENRSFDVRSDYDPNDRKWKIEYGVAHSPNYKP
jgi:hypothetical protein